MNLRYPVAALSLTAAGFVGILLREGYVEQAMQPLPGDKYTYGFGSTTREDGSPVRPGDTVDPVKAVVKAYMDSTKYEGAVKRCVRVPLTQKEYDLYVDFSYNVGDRAFCGSTMVRKLNVSDYVGACKEFLKWKYFKKKDCSIKANKCSGLWTSRQNSYAACMAEQGE